MIIATFEFLAHFEPLVLALIISGSFTICLKQIQAQNKKPQTIINKNFFL